MLTCLPRLISLTSPFIKIQIVGRQITVNPEFESPLLKNKKNTDKRPDVWSRPLCTYRGIISPKKKVFGFKKFFF